MEQSQKLDLLDVVPAGRDALAFSCEFPPDWVRVPLPDEPFDPEDPTAFLPLLVGMAPYGAVVFSVAARPAYSDGTVQDWVDYLAAQQPLDIKTVREARLGPHPAILVDATQDSEAGRMTVRTTFVEDGGRFYNIGAMAPEAIWSSVGPLLERMLGSFRLAQTAGPNAQLMRQMTSEPSVVVGAVEQPPKSEQVHIDVDTEDPRLTANPPPDLDDGPPWWTEAQRLEQGDRLEDAEALLQRSIDHIGCYSQIAHLYELRMARLAGDGDAVGARAAGARAIEWLNAYAASATSGGEGAALSRERDQRVEAILSALPSLSG